MEITTALIITLIVIVIVYILLRILFSVRIWSAFAGAIFVGLILLPFLFPMTRVNLDFNSGIWNSIYLGFILFASIVVVIYIIYSVLSDREDIIFKGYRPTEVNVETITV